MLDSTALLHFACMKEAVGRGGYLQVRLSILILPCQGPLYSPTQTELLPRLASGCCAI